MNSNTMQMNLNGIDSSQDISSSTNRNVKILTLAEFLDSSSKGKV
jgi:hypothetical protein